MALRACPFCREMFQDGEHDACPECGVKLTAFEKLPPSAEATEDELGIPVEPQHEKIPPSDLRRGKGALAALALLGIIFFFFPWVRETLPNTVDLTGFDMARRMGWSWGAACAWVVVIPTVLSRQSIAQLRGARVATTFLAAVPGVTVAILLARPPHPTRVPLVFTWGWSMYASLAVSLLGCLVSLRLGGRADDVAVARGSSRGQTLH